MNRTPRKRLVTLMAAAAGVTAALGASLSTPQQALARTATEVTSDTLKSKPAAAKKSTTAAKPAASKSSAAKTTAAKKPAAPAKKVVSTSAQPAEHDANADGNADGTGY